MASWLTASLARATACAAALSTFGFSAVDASADVPVNPAVLASPSPISVPSSVPPSGSINIAFDQIDRTIPLPATPPPLDGFAADLAAIQKAHSAAGMDMSSDITTSIVSTIAQEALSQIPIIGAFLGAAAARAQANAAKKRFEEALEAMSPRSDVGYVTRYYFYNGWTRSEVVGLVVIAKPEQHLKIFLDTQRKTYRTQDMAAPEPTLAEDASATPVAISTKADVTGSMSQAESANIAGLPTASYNLDATVTLAGSVDPCHDGSFQVRQLSYLTQLPEPESQEESQPPALYLLALPDGSQVTMHQQIAGAPPATGQMYLYRLVTVIRDPEAASRPAPAPKATNPTDNMLHMFSVSGGPGPNYMKLSERSNLRPCSAADAALFDIPSDYRQIR